MSAGHATDLDDPDRQPGDRASLVIERAGGQRRDPCGRRALKPSRQCLVTRREGSLKDFGQRDVGGLIGDEVGAQLDFC